MEIKVNIDDVDLNTVVGARVEIDEDGDRVETGGYTIADAVIGDLVKGLRLCEEYGGLRRRVSDIRDEEIRKLVRDEIAAVFGQVIAETNRYGEPTGRTTTLIELIVAEANRCLTTQDRYSSGKTLGQKLVADAVGAAIKRELSEAIAAEREKVVAAVRAQAATLIADAVKQGIGTTY
jgi:hypothetical protein